MSAATSIEVRVVATLERIAPIDEPAWSEFEGICVYRLVHVISAPQHVRDVLEEGQQLNVVATKRGAGPTGMLRTILPATGLQVGEKYELLLSERLPDGWQAIEDSFSDERIGLAAAIQITACR